MKKTTLKDLLDIQTLEKVQEQISSGKTPDIKKAKEIAAIKSPLEIQAQTIKTNKLIVKVTIAQILAQALMESLEDLPETNLEFDETKKALKQDLNHNDSVLFEGKTKRQWRQANNSLESEMFLVNATIRGLEVNLLMRENECIEAQTIIHEYLTKIEVLKNNELNWLHKKLGQ